MADLTISVFANVHVSWDVQFIETVLTWLYSLGSLRIQHKPPPLLPIPFTPVPSLLSSLLAHVLQHP